MPAMILPRVDLPAPFSPTSAWQWPAWISKLTRSRAVTPAKNLEMPSNLRIGWPAWATISQTATPFPAPASFGFHWRPGSNTISPPHLALWG